MTVVHVIHDIGLLHGFILILRVGVGVIEHVGRLRWKYVSVAIDLLLRSCVVSVARTLVSAGLRSILVSVRVPIVTTIIEPDLSSGIGIASDIVIIAIESKAKSTGGCFCLIVISVDRQSTITAIDNKVIIVAIDIDDYFTVPDDKGVVIAMNI